jgi:tRNA (cmo5U34)-methyltransferase
LLSVLYILLIGFPAFIMKKREGGFGMTAKQSEQLRETNQAGQADQAGQARQVDQAGQAGQARQARQTVKKLFDAVAEQYDQQRKQLIPCFDEFYGMAAALVEAPDEAPHILDLGAGTGLYSALVRQKYPNARFTLIDLSESMLETARTRFAAASQIEYIVADYTRHPFTERFDIVISSLSIHHLSHPEKRKLFRTVHRLLVDGGSFVNADQAAGNTSSADAYYRRRWEESIRESGLSDEAIAAAKHRRTLDRNASAADQIRWLQQAGFVDVDCMYKYLDFAVFYGSKPALD